METIQLNQESRFVKQLMGGELEFRFYHLPELIASELVELAYLEGKRLEKIFNIYDSKSELSQLNNKRKTKVSLELLEVLKKALEFSELTSGVYDISFGKNFIERKQNKTLSKLDCSYKDIRIEGDKVELVHPDVLIDLGSLAKGYIVDKLLEFISGRGVENFLVNGRGDLRIFGEIEETINLQHPRDKDKIIYKFKIKNQAIATSGDYNQYYDSYENSHIVGKKEIISCSVIAPTLIEADVFATCLMILDKEKREQLMNKFPEYKVLLIDSELKIYKKGVV